MVPIFKFYRHKLLAVVFVFFTLFVFSQSKTSDITAQFAFGINSPSKDGFVTDFDANSVNFPTINLGVQYMFKPLFGIKLDMGYNRFSNSKTAQPFQTNYTRLNAQFVYKASDVLGFSSDWRMFLHGGPGISKIKPLGNYRVNKRNEFNTVTGLEFHYAPSYKVSWYLDASYILGFGKDFGSTYEGFGSFNGNLLTITVGASFSLSGCRYCN